MWNVETDGQRIEVKTGAEEITRLDGAVTYRRGDIRGERCGNEISVTMDMHGARGQEVLGRLRAVPNATVMISRHTLVIQCAEQEHVDKALKIIGELAPKEKKVEVTGMRWLSDRMFRCEVSPRTPLTTSNRTFGFDSEVRPVPFQIYFDQEGRKIGSGDLTELGEQLLASIVEFVKRSGVAFVSVSRTCFDFCLSKPCEGEDKRSKVESDISLNLNLAIA